ncbi:MAG: 3-hydroxybutyryl-CoA dehydrogenase [Gemmatimonadaceae bacterium]|nr:3-hydroxybutyryl-CoA dehydrogenase [Gemmatimonadaceae bacterium]
MGSGIAQVASTAGHRVLLHDMSADVARRGVHEIGKSLARQTEKKKISEAQSQSILERISVVSGGEGNFSSLADCDIVIEAIVENLAVKTTVFGQLEECLGPDAVLATNTSSLSVTAIARACKNPRRVVGVHFFNPATVMPLVEIVPGLQSDSAIVGRTRALVDLWGKQTVLASDTPGFIVNRIARPFYGEALRIFEEGIADRTTIDWAMREIGGFRMGPFELMDFIGNDINLAATTAVFEATYFDPRYKPSLTQRRLVDAGMLGRKSGRGHYDYAHNAETPLPDKDQHLGRHILNRILSMLINEAVDAVAFAVGTAEDIELAMTKGVNYPKGLLAWGQDIGLSTVLETLERLQREYGEDRYRPSHLLRRMVREGTNFF